jgi:hypothetical protein
MVVAAYSLFLLKNDVGMSAVINASNFDVSESVRRRCAAIY